MSHTRRRLPFETWVFYGWVEVVMVAGVLCVGVPIVTSPFGNFLLALQAEGWTRSELSWALSATLFGALSQPVWGYLVDRFGPRWVFRRSVFGYGVAWMSLYFTASLPHLYISYFLIGVFGMGVGPVTCVAILNRWFDRRRGLAIGLAMAGIGIGGAVMAPFSRWLITTVGWRLSYVIIGLLAGLVISVLTELYLRERPESFGLLPDGEPRSQEPAESAAPLVIDASVREASRTLNFWLLTAAFFLLSIAVHGILAHLIPLLADRGVSIRSAAWVMFFVAMSSTAGRGVAGWLADGAQARWEMGAKWVALGSFLGAALGIGVLWYWLGGGHQGTFMLAVFVLCFGLGVGAEVDLFPFMITRSFGLKHFGRLYGLVLCSFVAGGIIGPPLTAQVFERTGSYEMALVAFIGIVFLAALLMIPLRGAGKQKREAGEQTAAAAPVRAQ